MKAYKKCRIFFKKMSLKNRLLLITALIITFSISLSNIITMTYSRNRMIRFSEEQIGNTIDQVSKNVREVLVSRVYTLSNLLMRDENIYNMLKYKAFEQADSLPTLPNMGDNLKAKKVLFSGYITRKYLIPTSDIKIVALVSSNGETTAVSYSDDFTPESLNTIQNLVKETQESNLTAVYVPTQKNIFGFRAGYGIRYNHIILAGVSLIRPDTGEKFGTAVFAIPEVDLYNTYSNIKLGITDEIFVCDDKGNLISSSDSEKLEYLRVEDQYAEVIQNNETGIEYIDGNGKQIMVVIRHIYGTPWVAAGKVPVGEMSQNVNVLITLTLLMITVGIIISLIFISFMSESIVKPVRRIIHAMNEAEHGNLNIAVEVKGQYEISEIAKYFNRMISRIRRLIEEEYEIERKKKEAEMNVLMGQINPHFLYNTLESIVWKAQIAGETQISDMAASLGRLYRLSVNRGELYVKVSEELEHVKAYTDIQKFRYKDMFDCDILVKDESLLDYKTLKMMLQPIVENSIVHCIKPVPSFVKITIDVERIEDNLIFTVQDNGKGMTPKAVENLMQRVNGYSLDVPREPNSKPRHEKGIGLKNINERIKLYFGTGYGIMLESEIGIGTKVIITVPIIHQSDSISHNETD